MNGVHRGRVGVNYGDRSRPLVIGLINNMRPAARAATERQFKRLLQAATSRDVCVRCFANDASLGLSQGYAEIVEVFEAKLDGLIVTGIEPQATSLRDELVWPMITRLADWADHHAVPTIWSCLAAHAAVLYLDGIDRVPFREKLSGVFPGEIVGVGHPLLDGFVGSWMIPHSRSNDVPESALRVKGYEIIARSDEAGADIFHKTINAQFVFFQGHPEYEPDTLLREFQRDVKRYCLRERENFPAEPLHYFQKEAEPLLGGLRAAAWEVREGGGEVPAILNQLSVHLRPSQWQPAAVTLFRNWVNAAAHDEACELPDSWSLKNASAAREGAAEMGLMP